MLRQVDQASIRTDVTWADYGAQAKSVVPTTTTMPPGGLDDVGADATMLRCSGSRCSLAGAGMHGEAKGFR
jgi:hypothetical protein